MKGRKHNDGSSTGVTGDQLLASGPHAQSLLDHIFDDLAAQLARESVRDKTAAARGVIALTIAVLATGKLLLKLEKIEGGTEPRWWEVLGTTSSGIAKSYLSKSGMRRMRQRRLPIQKNTFGRGVLVLIEPHATQRRRWATRVLSDDDPVPVRAEVLEGMPAIGNRILDDLMDRLMGERLNQPRSEGLIPIAIGQLIGLLAAGEILLSSCESDELAAFAERMAALLAENEYERLARTL